MGLSKTAPEFQRQIAFIATKAGKEPDTVYGLWREYSSICDGYDQSPVLSEFRQWYASQLEPADTPAP